MRLDDVYRTLWQYKLLIASLTAALVGLSWWLTSLEKPVYEAATLVRVQQRIDDPGQSFNALATGQELAKTYATISETDTIAGRIRDALGGAVPLADIKGHVHGQAVQDLDLLWIRVRGNDPAQITRIANAAPSALRDYIAQTGTLHDVVTTAEAATRPRSPVAPSKSKNMVLALVLGLLLNSGIALAVKVLRDPVGSAEEIERASGLPVLAAIPPLRFPRRAANDRPAAPSREAAVVAPGGGHASAAGTATHTEATRG